MAANLLPFRPAGIRASDAGAAYTQRRRPGPNQQSSSSSGWWTPLFGWPSEPDYIESSSPGKLEKPNQTRPALPEPTRKSAGTRFAPGCFTEEKARQLRMMTLDTSSFHDAMYHSAIAARLASDFGPTSELNLK
ncbi:hypothetical protein SAY86_026236 [Trapa natans]|uniref:Uncharacterized protein n=1 Tax=Trapa natans TaxID=22666 RepID=A0AAN7KDZ2_TRANT|nr:hypothetical protein SAY86_026236 [Trapa natans]